MKTDAQLQNDVLAELHWDPSINAAQIGVEVKNGAVTLSGHLDWEYQRQAALQRRARNDSKNIAVAVAVDGTVVTLSGALHTWSERELARQSAWGTPRGDACGG